MIYKEILFFDFLKSMKTLLYSRSDLSISKKNIINSYSRPRSNTIIATSKSNSEDLSKICNKNDLWLIILPGWTQNCTETVWIRSAIKSMYNIYWFKH